MKCMKTWEIDRETPDQQIGGFVEPKKAYLRRSDQRVEFVVTGPTEWTAAYPTGILAYIRQNGRVSCFTTAPQEVLKAWFGGDNSIVLVSNGSRVRISRAGAGAGETWEGVYKKYGPYWRRFLCLDLCQEPEGNAGEWSVETTDLANEAELWPIYFRLKETTDLNRLNGRFILPPWDPDCDGAGQADSDFGYYRLSSSREGEAPSGVPAREAMRKKMRVAGAEEPLALALWRAADDLALRPEMLAGAQIKIGGLPEDFGKIGAGTCPLLCVPTPKTDVEKYRKKVLDLAVAYLQVPDEGQPSGAVQELAKAISSDLEKVFGTREIEIMDLHKEDKALCLPDFLNHGAEARENSPVFSVTQNLGKDYKKCLLTNGKFLVSPAVSDFAKRWFRPTSVQTFWDPDFWYTLVQFGWTGEEGLVPNEFNGKCRKAADIIKRDLEPSVDEFHEGDWAALCRTTCLPERGAPSGPTRAVLHAALMLPANTKILWGRAALLDEPLSRFDNQSVLG